MIKRFSNNLSLPKIDRIFWQARFPERKVCIKCNHRKLFKLTDGRLKCKRCGFRFFVTRDTHLSKSRLSLDQWYELLWWFVYEFTANKTSKEIDLPQKLIHRSFSLIRKAIYDYELQEMIQFFGEIEVDETYIGPKFRNRRKKNRDKYRKLNVVKRGRGVKDLQQPIFGIYQRNGKVYIEFVEKVDRKTLQDIIKGRVVLDSKIYSDSWKSYRGLKKKGYEHQTVDHGKEEYVRQINNGKAHINGIEGFWGYLKERLLKHHGVADKNLIFYVKEIEFRFNNRHLPTEQLIRKLIQILLSKKLIYLEEILSETKLSEPIKFRFKQQILLRNLVKIGPPDD